jgi:hypothetical protein
MEIRKGRKKIGKERERDMWVSILKKDRENLFEDESREWVYSCVNVSLACNVLFEWLFAYMVRVL